MITAIGYGLAFCAGICVGVVLNEKDIVNVEDLRHGGEILVKGSRAVILRVRSEFKPAPDAPATT